MCYSLLRLLAIIAALLQLNSPAIWAASGCTAKQSSVITFPDLSTNRDMRIGTSYPPYFVQSTNALQFSCSYVSQSMFGLRTKSPYLTSFNGMRIYATNVAGIGYAVGLATQYPGCGSYSKDDPSAPDKQKYYVCVNMGSGYNMPWQGAFYFTFYKTANVAESGTVDLSGMIYGIVVNDGVAIPVEIPLLTNSFKVTANTCNVVSISPNPVTLPDIGTQSSLPTINSVYGSTPFNISVNCSTPTQLYITFTDKSDIGQTGRILFPDANSSAQGLGVELRYNGDVVGFGPDTPTPGNINQIYLDNVSGLQSIPFSASYIRIGTITPGVFSAAATFTLSYQ
ncbi:hypothetical protein DBR44_16975 [Aquitalea sp. FJL05]|nr:hypothetical protein DBR44_16975 [Aquitalea sp. FJL05]